MDVKSLSDEINAAIKAHGAWKGRLRIAALKKDTTLPVADICRDDRCQFGQWLKALPRDTATRPEVVEIRRGHAEFHRMAGEIAKMIRKGETQQALDALAGEAYREVSSGLVRKLTRWKLHG